MNYHSRYRATAPACTVALCGTGAFGKSLLEQSRRVAQMEIRVVMDLTAERAAEAAIASGWASAAVAICQSEAEAREAWKAGKLVAVASLEVAAGLGVDILVEATGHPEAGARHALAAIENGWHVVLVTKETDSVVGPVLTARARKAGVVVAPVDGDQPALLIDLITWAEVIGLDVIGAGKSSEYDFVLDDATGLITSNGISHAMPELAAHYRATGTTTARQRALARGEILGQKFPLRAVPDLCELTLVANATGCVPDHPAFHAPVARVSELADLFRDDAGGGVLRGVRRLDVFHHLRLSDEASFAGGVFITVRCHDRETWQVLAEKGHVVSKDGSHAAIYLPRHLLGVEAATTILDAALRRETAYPDSYSPKIDLIAVASRDLAAGTMLTAEGHHHTISGVSAEMRPASPLAAMVSCPYYLVANRRLVRPVNAGQAITLADVEPLEGSLLAILRAEQDKLFLS